MTIKHFLSCREFVRSYLGTFANHTSVREAPGALSKVGSALLCLAFYSFMLSADQAGIKNAPIQKTPPRSILAPFIAEQHSSSPALATHPQSECQKKKTKHGLVYAIPAVYSVEPAPINPRSEAYYIEEAQLPYLHSLPSAPQKLYLNFTGCAAATWGGYQGAGTPPYDRDGDPSRFSSSEVEAIETIWKRVSEDYAPFKIDVTTERPGSFGAKQAMEVCIGGNGSWYQAGVGGVAYNGVWASTDPRFHRVFVFAENLGNGDPKFTAEAASHEDGHTFGLNHHAEFSATCALLESYLFGNGRGETGWAPTMGVGYYQNWVTWYDGNPFFCRSQNDLAQITSSANGITYRTDDHGNTVNAATPFTLLSRTTLFAAGVISQSSDRDMFSFSTGAGTVTITADNFEPGPNLDMELRLVQRNGSEILRTNPGETLDAAFSTYLNAGTYFVEVGPGSAYGSLGQYTVTGVIVEPAVTATPTPSPTATRTPTFTATPLPTATLTNTPEPTATAAALPSLPPVASGLRPHRPGRAKVVFGATTAQIVMASGYDNYQIRVQTDGCKERTTVTKSKRKTIKLQSRSGRLSYRVKNDSGWSKYSPSVGLRPRSGRAALLRCMIS